METGGIEQPSLTHSKTAISEDRRTESGTVKDDCRKNDPDLAYLVKVWSSLQDTVKKAIMDLTESKEPSPKTPRKDDNLDRGRLRDKK